MSSRSISAMYFKEQVKLHLNYNTYVVYQSQIDKVCRIENIMINQTYWGQNCAWLNSWLIIFATIRFCPSPKFQKLQIAFISKFSFRQAEHVTGTYAKQHFRTQSQENREWQCRPRSLMDNNATLFFFPDYLKTLYIIRININQNFQKVH